MADNEPASDIPLPPPVPATASVATVGETLRAARIALDLTVEQLSTELRIEARQLTAIEENRFEQIGVPVFIKGYIRQYGQRCGLNVADLLLLYYQQGRVAEVEVQPNRTIKLRDERQVSTFIVTGLVLATIAVGFAAWWWNGGTFEGVPGALPAPPAASSTADDPAASAAAPRTSDPPTAQVSTTPVVVPPGIEAGGPVEVQAAPAVLPGDDTSERAAVPTTIPLEFSFAEESWAEVSDARGERLLFGLSATGRQVTVRGEPPFAILLGNADSVQLRVDGESYTIPTTGRQGDLVRFSVDIAEE
jgi:cytoskeleton protein RodZ